jgi:addiction module RelE/StbE family toxin
MTEIAFSSTFTKAYRKRIKGQPNIENKFWRQVDIFKNDPFDNRIKTHKLSGRLKDLWSFRIDYDNRVIFYFVDDKKDRAVFVDIGRHDVVY